MSIVFEKVNYSYLADSDLAFQALTDVSLTIGEGEFIGIIGHTGSGKSTLMQHMNGLLLPTSGSVTVDGFLTSDKTQLRQARSRVGMVFQYPEYQLFEETVIKDVMFGPKNLGLDEATCKQRAKDAMAQVGLDPERFSELSPFELSGGEKRRAAIAGIIAIQPKYLALDEPMAGLDPRGRKEIMELLEKFRTELGCTIIMISHSMDDMARYAQRIAVLDHGSLVMLGTPGEIFSQEEKLSEMGLSVPQSARLTHLLIRSGLDLPRDIVTMESLADELLKEGN